MPDDIVVDGLKLLGITITPALIVLIICITNADKLITVSSYFFSVFSNISVRADKISVERRIRGEVLQISKEISKQNSELLPFDLKVCWVENEDTQSFIDENKIIVRIRKNSNPNHNIIMALSEFIRLGLIPNWQVYIGIDLYEASNLSIIRKLLQNRKSTLGYYYQNFFDPARENLNIEQFIEYLLKIDDNGMLVSIYLNEINKAVNSRYPKPPDPCLKAEASEFLRYLYNIASRVKGEESPELYFNREYFKVSIGLMAVMDNVINQGYSRYLNALRKAVEEGINSIYLLGYGHKNINFAEEVANKALEKNSDLNICSKNYYKHRFENGETKNGVCIELNIIRPEEF